jgi:hypothetical protein
MSLSFALAVTMETKIEIRNHSIGAVWVAKIIGLIAAVLELLNSPGTLHE